MISRPIPTNAMKRIAFLLIGLSMPGVISSFAADVREGLISYWPLDTLDLTQNITPDVVAGNNMQLYDITDSSVLKPGKFGQAFSFDAALQQACYFTADPSVDTGLPATRNTAYSILL